MTNKDQHPKIVQTAGRDALGEFAPDFAHYNDDILFGENWNNQDLDLKTRSLITVIALISSGITDQSLTHHLTNAKDKGVTQPEIAAAITHAAFYVGWPKAWVAFRLAQTIWETPTTSTPLTREEYQQQIFFPIGEPNEAFAAYFTGQSYLAEISNRQVLIHNVTFEPGCRNHWHKHSATSGGGQMLICVGGRGWYQERGKEPVELTPGSVVHVPANTEHWHGAAHNTWMSHLAFPVPGENTSNDWLEPVTDHEYNQLP